MKKIISFILSLVLLVGVLYNLNTSIEINDYSKMIWGGSLYYQNFENNQIDDMEYESSGTMFLIKLDDIVDTDSIKNSYLEQINEENVDFMMKTYREEVKREYTKIRSVFYEKFSDLIDDDLEISSPYVSLYTEELIIREEELNDDIKSILNDPTVESVTAYILNVYNRNLKIIECLYEFCGGGGGTSPYEGSHNDIDEKYNFSNILTAINANEVKQTYDGSGVKVGILDGDIINRYNSGFSSKSVHLLTSSGIGSSHGTNVANVAVGKDGVAPSAEVFSAAAKHNSERMIGVNNLDQLQLFADNGVNVVNMSIGYYYNHNYGPYTVTGSENDAISLMYDKFVTDNLITLVAASGNEKKKIMGAPAMSSNIITVGSTNYNGTTLSDYHTYLVPKALPKPLVVAPGEMKIPNGIFNSAAQFNSQTGVSYPYLGTSYAAPLVTGSIALLMQAKPILKFFPEIIVSLLASTANINKLGIQNESSNRFYAGINIEGGAGILDVGNLVHNIHNYTYFSSNGNAPDSIGTGVTLAEFSVSKNVEIRVTIFWFAQINSNLRTITDYDLVVFQDGVAIESSTSATSNLEHVRFKTSKSGIIRIVVRRYGVKKGVDSDHGAVSWSLKL